MKQNIKQWMNAALLICAISLLLPSCFKNSKIKERSESDAGETDTVSDATTTGDVGTATDTRTNTESNNAVDAGTDTSIVTGTGSTEKSDTDKATGATGSGNAGSDTEIVTDTGSDSAEGSITQTDTETVPITVTDTGSDSAMASQTEADTVTETGGDNAGQTDTGVVTDSAVQTDTGVVTDSAVPTDTETETDPNKRCGAERVDCTVTEQICNAEGMCEPKPCTKSTDCPSSGYACNMTWGYCAVSSCSGHADFTRCNLITGEPDRSYDICVNETCRSPGCGDASCNVPYPYFPLPDTGQKECYDNETVMTTSCPASGDFFGQDAQYGWDTAPTGPRFTRDDSSSEPVVTDNITGLIWQGCPDGLTGSDCNADTAAIATEYEWEEAVAHCEGLVWGGHNDWRLPDRYALESIVDMGTADPAVDMKVFPKTPSDNFWSSSAFASDASRAWYINFNVGVTDTSDKDGPRDVRCVRGQGFGPLVSTGATAPRYSRQNSGADDWTVTDHATGLIWQGCTAGLTGEACDIDTGQEDTYSWQNALAYCEALGFGGSGNWRLPNMRELLSIADDERTSPAADPAIFPETPNHYLRSSSSFALSPPLTWVVQFGGGHLTYVGKDEPNFFVRCVRNEP